MKSKKKLIRLFGPIALFAVLSFWISCNSGSDSAVSNAGDTSTKVSAMPDTSMTTAKSKNKGTVSVAAPTVAAAGNMTMDVNGIYNHAEVAPSYPGGESALDSYIQNHIEYPTNALNNEIQGPVVIQFAVDTNGKVFQVTELSKKVGYGIDEEAMRIVSNMPDWTAGTIHGKKVRAYREIPITFTLTGENEGVH